MKRVRNFIWRCTPKIVVHGLEVLGIRNLVPKQYLLGVRGTPEMIQMGAD